MTGRQKRYSQILAAFLLGGCLAGICYNLARGHLTPVHLATGATFGLMIASGIGAFEALVSQGAARLWLRSLPFGAAVAVRSLVYAAVIFPIQYYDLGVKVFGLKSIDTPKDFWTATAYSIGVVVLFNLLLEISYFIGPRRFLHLVAGLYHAPREEERFVLFVDVAGSTGAAERLGNLRSHTMLDRVFRVATGPVLDFGGEIDQYVGDEMIVTWPAARGATDGRALRCFLAMREALAKASGGFEREFGRAPQVRGSLHFGPVVVGEIGDTRRDIVFHGDVMNTAARLEEASRTISGGFVVSRSAHERLGQVETIDLESLGAFNPRGRLQPIEIFGLACFHPSPWVDQVTAPPLRQLLELDLAVPPCGEIDSAAR
jgi:adenylate cyclase